MKCQLCDSLQVARFRIDSDWCPGAGDFYPVNDEKHYTEEQLKDFDRHYRPDIEVYYCLNCRTFFE